jgi:hypothetical protein
MPMPQVSTGADSRSTASAAPPGGQAAAAGHRSQRHDASVAPAIATELLAAQQAQRVRVGSGSPRCRPAAIFRRISSRRTAAPNAGASNMSIQPG